MEANVVPVASDVKVAASVTVSGNAVLALVSPVMEVTAVLPLVLALVMRPPSRVTRLWRWPLRVRAVVSAATVSAISPYVQATETSPLP